MDGRGPAQLFLIVGGPTASMRSPAIWNAQFARTGRNALLAPLAIRADDLPAAFALLRSPGSNVSGLIVTTPHKRAAAGLVDRLDGDAPIAGVVNAVRRDADGHLRGTLLDGDACVAAAGPRATGLVFVAGAGDAGRAVAAAFARAGAVVALRDANPDKAAAAAAALQAAGHKIRSDFGDPELEGADVIVNATPLGERPGDEPPVAPRGLDPRTVVIDLAGGPATRLAGLARGFGCRLVDAGQAAAAQAPLLAGFFGFDWQDGPRGATRIAGGAGLCSPAKNGPSGPAAMVIAG